MIKINYTSEAKSLGRASALFMDKRPIMRLAVIFLNIMAILLMLVLVLKIIFLNISPKDAIIIICCITWVFFRKRFNIWLFTKRVTNSPLINNEIEIKVSVNGIIWSGKKMLDGKLAWDNIRYALESQNGFILPYCLSKFLWLPFSGFEKGSDLDEFRKLLKEKSIKLKTCYQYKC